MKYLITKEKKLNLPVYYIDTNFIVYVLNDKDVLNNLHYPIFKLHTEGSLIQQFDQLLPKLKNLDIRTSEYVIDIKDNWYLCYPLKYVYLTIKPLFNKKS